MSLRARNAALWMLFASLFLGAGCHGGAPPEEPEVTALSEPEPQPEPLPPPLSHYMGREIATTMHWSASDWLWRESREAEESSAQMLAALGVRAGQTVCDLGAGSGYHTLHLSRMVGAEGRVLAVDIQAEMLALLSEKAREAGAENIELILGEVADPLLPAASCDLVLMVDVYHEISYPAEVLAKLKAALRPGGRVAFVEFRGEDPDVPIKKNHKMTAAQVREELEASGYRLDSTYDELPWQHLMMFVVAE